MVAFPGGVSRAGDYIMASGDKQAITRIDPLIVDDRAADTGPIVAEESTGALTLASFNLIDARLRALTVLAAPADLWDRVAVARFSLARQGVQANLVDLAIAVTANAAGQAR